MVNAVPMARNIAVGERGSNWTACNATEVAEVVGGVGEPCWVHCARAEWPSWEKML